MTIDLLLLQVGGTIGAVLLIVGLASAYGGFVIYKLYIWLVGFVFGLGGGGIAGLAFTADSAGNLLNFVGNLGDNLLVVGAAALIGGFLGGAIAVALQKLMVGALGFLATVLLTAGVTGADPTNPLILVFGGVGGVLAWAAYAWAIILATAVLGAMTVSAVATYGSGFSGISSVVFTPLFWFIFLSGAAVQGGLFSTFGLLDSDDTVEWDTDSTTEGVEKDDVAASSDTPDSEEYGADGGATTTDITPVGDTHLCPACAAPTHAGYSYCYHCGGELDAETDPNEELATDVRNDAFADADRFCTECGGPAYDEYSYCYNCGGKLTTETITSEPVYPRPTSLLPLVPPSTLSTTDIVACSKCSARNEPTKTQCYYCNQSLTT
jgi:hypothetical protein